MAIEIEKKYRLPSDFVEELKVQLREAGADFHGNSFEQNTIYGGGVLDEKGAILRIRETDDKSLLTYKRRIDNFTDVKRQIEHESEFTDAEELAEMLNELGFKPKLLYEKRRARWTFRNVEIVIDELPFGWFVEIEGPITAIKEAEILLDIDQLETVHETYPQLTVRFGKPKEGVIEARFAEL